MIAEDRQRVRRDRTGGDVEDRRRQFAGDLVHVGNHQQQTLRCRKRRRQRPRLQGAMDGAGSAAFRLQFDNLGNAAPDVGLALCRPLVGQFAHAGRRSDRVNRDHFGNAKGNRGNGLIAVDGQHLVHGSSWIHMKQQAKSRTTTKPRRMLQCNMIFYGNGHQKLSGDAAGRRMRSGKRPWHRWRLPRIPRPLRHGVQLWRSLSNARPRCS